MRLGDPADDIVPMHLMHLFMSFLVGGFVKIDWVSN